MTTPAARLRTAMQSEALTVAPGVYDPFGACVSEKMGFEAVYLGGNSLGLHLGVGQPYVTLTETAQAVQSITRACGLPLIVDAGAGFGDAAHAHITMRTLACAGAAAVHIDDQIYPKRAHYHVGNGLLVPTAEMTAKLRAMAKARTGNDVLLIARTDALRTTRSLKTTLERCSAYVAAGCDALIVLDLGIADAPSFACELPDTPLIWIGGIEEPIPSKDELRQSGFSGAVYPFTLIAAVLEAMQATLEEIRRTGKPPPRPEPGREVVRRALEIVGLDALLEIEAGSVSKPNEDGDQGARG